MGMERHSTITAALNRVMGLVRKLDELEREHAQVQQELAGLLNLGVPAAAMPVRTAYTPGQPAAVSTESDGTIPVAKKADRLSCIYAGCNFKADTQDELDDHITGCMDNDL